MKICIEVTFRTKKGFEAFFQSEELSVEKAIQVAEDLEKTGRIKQITYIDKHEISWSLKELKKYTEEIETEPHNIVVYFDGGFDRESYQSGLGCVIYYEQNQLSYRIRKNAFIEELSSNNEAEYAAFELCVTELELLGAHHIPVTFIGDSQVVINQLSGEWPCYEEELMKFINRIERKLEALGIEPEYQLTPRSKNKEADQLASQALRGIDISSKHKL